MSAGVEAIAKAWMRHQGYTEDDIAVAETDTHQASGCEFCTNHMTWDCIDPETNQSRHPMWDALDEAVEMANVALEALESVGSLNAFDPFEGGRS